MAQAQGRGRFVAVVVGLLVVAGALLFWARSDRGKNAAEVAGARDGRGAVSRFAADPGEEPSKPAGAIEGIVLDEKGQPVADAAVVLARTRRRDEVGPMGEFGRALDVAKSGSDGRFSFVKVAGGSYSVSAMAEGRRPAAVGPIDTATPEAKRVELRLTSGGVLLSGHIYDAGGGPVPKARVRALEAQMGGTLGVPHVYQTVADDNGAYKLYLGSAQYTVTAEADGYAPGYDWFMLTRPLVRDLRLSPAARIVGRVVEGTDKNPVPDAELWLLLQRAGGTRPRDVKADAEGAFVFNDLEPGTYRVGARKGRLIGMSTSVSLGLAQTATDVEVALNPGFVVAGRVTGATGQPVNAARVQLWKDQPPFERPFVTKTDGSGQFRFEGVLPTQFRLETSAEGLARARQELRVTSDVPNLEVKLGPGATVKGEVLGSDGKPVAGVALSLQVQTRDRTMGGTFERATSGADGRFEIGSLPAGDITLTAQHKDHGIATLSNEKLGEAEQKVVALKLEAGGSIAGVVKLDDGTPAAGARVEGMRMGGPSNRWADVTAPDGTFKLTGISAGNVTVVASTTRSMSWGGQDRPDQKTVTMTEREHKTGIDLIVPGAKSISGLVVGPDGKPISGAEVTAAVERNGRAFRSGGNNSRAFSAPDGTFTIEQLGAGKHTLWAVDPGFADAEVKGIDGGATGVKLTFAAASTIAGVVVGADNKPVADYTITLLPGPKPNESPEDKRQRQFASPWEVPTDTVHDPAGQFFFPRVGPGNHELRVKTADGKAGSESVSIAAGEKKQGVRIVLQQGARLTGRIVEADGDRPLANVEIRAFSMTASGNRPATRTDPSGAFALEGVSSGETIMVNITGDPGTHLSERRKVETKPGTTDLGTIKLARGNVDARIKEGTWQGLTGVNNSEDTSGTILQARPGSPAEKAGLKSGDRILSIDGKDMRGQSFGVLEYSLRGKPNTPVSITVQTPGSEPRVVTFNRTAGDMPSPAAPPATATAGTATTGQTTGGTRPAVPAAGVQPAAARTTQ